MQLGKKTQDAQDSGQSHEDSASFRLGLISILCPNGGGVVRGGREQGIVLQSEGNLCPTQRAPGSCLTSCLSCAWEESAPTEGSERWRAFLDLGFPIQGVPVLFTWPFLSPAVSVPQNTSLLLGVFAFLPRW